MTFWMANYKILTDISDGGIEELKRIEDAARVCYKSEDRITEDGESAKKLIASLIKRGHEAMLEHSSLTVRFRCDRGVSHELVRHRLASFAQESTRYCNYSNEKFGHQIVFIMPSQFMDSEYSLDDENLEVMKEWKAACEDAERHYLAMIEHGATPQLARSVLPTCVKTDIVVTANYREWRHILDLRANPAAHPDISSLMNSLLKELKKKIPIIFDDIPGLEEEADKE